MTNSTSQNESGRMTLDELFRKTFSTLLATLIDTFAIFEDPSSTKSDSRDSDD